MEDYGTFVNTTKDKLAFILEVICYINGIWFYPKEYCDNYKAWKDEWEANVNELLDTYEVANLELQLSKHYDKEVTIKIKPYTCGRINHNAQDYECLRDLLKEQSCDSLKEFIFNNTTIYVDHD